MRRRLAPFGLVIAAGSFGFVVGARWAKAVVMRAAVEVMLKREAERTDPFAYLRALAEEFGSLTADVVMDGSGRPNCGYCDAKRPDGATGPLNLHVDGPWHFDTCPYYDPVVAPVFCEDCPGVDDHDPRCIHA